MNTDVFYSLPPGAELPDIFSSPFDVLPHAVAEQAASSLKLRISDLCGDAHHFDAPDGGKMFGVLVVRKITGEVGYLSAFSGMLGGRWRRNGFVDPVFNVEQRRSVLAEGERFVVELSRKIDLLQSAPGFIEISRKLERLDAENLDTLATTRAKHAQRKQQRRLQREHKGITPAQLELLANLSRKDKVEFKTLQIQLKEQSADLRSHWTQAHKQIEALKQQRKEYSHDLQAELFDGYQLQSADSTTRAMAGFFKTGYPPSGAGDCAAIKLVQYANQHQLQPVALAEFWWGASPVGGLRQHGRYYPSCRSRCRVLLPFLLGGVDVAIPRHEQLPDFSAEYPRTIHEDDDIVVVDKPAGLLSVPGKVLTDSIETRLKARYPEVAGVMLLHRLDQATSGVMIAARNPRAYKILQHQFQDRVIEKEYVAVLDGIVEQEHGEIKLPLRVDIYDRPRQIVCAERGKSALTRYSVISYHEGTTRVAFYPHTGRTHQLRVHAAHPEGLDCPILGDELYGRPLERMHLHAQRLTFDHPVTGCRMSFTSEPTF